MLVKKASLNYGDTLMKSEMKDVNLQIAESEINSQRIDLSSKSYMGPSLAKGRKNKAKSNCNGYVEGSCKFKSDCC